MKSSRKMALSSSCVASNISPSGLHVIITAQEIFDDRVVRRGRLSLLGLGVRRLQLEDQIEERLCRFAVLADRSVKKSEQDRLLPSHPAAFAVDGEFDLGIEQSGEIGFEV